MVIGMPSPAVVNAIIGVSSLLGFLGLLGYLFFLLQRRTAERSIREIAEGEGLFNAKLVVSVLAQFKDDAARLGALKEIANLDASKAKILLKKVEGNVDANRLNSEAQIHYRILSARIAVFFVTIAIIGAGYKLAERYWPHDSEAVVSDKQVVLDCGSLGRFTVSSSEATIFGGSRETYTSQDAVPIYSGDRDYGFWMYDNDTHAIRRYYLDRSTLSLSSADVPMPYTDYEDIHNKASMFAENSRRADEARGTHSSIRDGQQFVAQIDQLIGPYKKSHGVDDTNQRSAYCSKIPIAL